MHSNMHISLAAPQETPLTHCSPLSSEKCHSFPIAVLTLCHPVLGLLNRAIIWLSNKEKNCGSYIEKETHGASRRRQAVLLHLKLQLLPSALSISTHLETAWELLLVNSIAAALHTHTGTHASNPDSVTTACTSPIPKYSFPSLLQQRWIALHPLSSCTCITDLGSSFSYT